MHYFLGSIDKMHRKRTQMRIKKSIISLVYNESYNYPVDLKELFLYANIDLMKVKF